MGKISSYPPDTSPTTDDYVISVDAGSGSNRRVLLNDLITLFFNNQPATAATSTTLAQDTQFDFVKPNTGVITADSAGVNRNASMTALTAYQNGQKLTISAVTARNYTANKDTYVDVLNTGGVGSLVYTEVTNNAASPALAANSIRIGIVVTGATTIAAAASINQGQEDRILPIASSVAYSVADSLGNLICPRDPNRRVLNYKQISANQTGLGTSATQITGFSLPVIVPLGRKIHIKCYAWATDNSGTATTTITIWDGTVGAGTQVGSGIVKQSAAGNGTEQIAEIETTPTAASKTYNMGLAGGSGTTGIYASAGNFSFAKVELA